MNKEHIQHLQNWASNANSDEAIPEPLTAAARRLSLDPVDWKKFVFCQTDLKKVPINCVQTLETSDKILKNAIFDKEMSCRLAGISDLRAAEGKYHLKCYSWFLRNTQKIPQDNQEKKLRLPVMSLLHQRLSEGHIYFITAVWTHYSNRLEQNSNSELKAPDPDKGCRGCGDSRCRVCNFMVKCITFKSKVTGRDFFINFKSDCNSDHVKDEVLFGYPLWPCSDFFNHWLCQ